MLLGKGRTLRFLCAIALLAVHKGATEQSEDDSIRMLSTSSNLNVIQGSTVLLPCNVLNLDRKVRIWKHLPSRILFSGTISVSRDAKIHLVNGSSLRIDDITPQYAGEYVCLISHHHFLNVTHRIQVLVSPSIEQEPPNGKAVVRKGNQATITCNVSGIPKPVVTWTHEHNGVQSPQLPSGVRQVLGGAQLQIASVDVHHAGVYRCTADNDVGEPAGAVFSFTVLYAPELTVKPEWIHGGEGATVEFMCTCHSAPPSHITWVKGDPKQDTPLQANDRIKLREKLTVPTTTESWLKLTRLRKEDLGSYACVAKNQVGQSFKMVELSGLAEPVQLRGDETGETSFLLTWTAKSYSPIIEYQLKIRRHKSDDEWTDVMIPVSEEGLKQSMFFSHSYNVTGLEPGTRYEVVLQAHNDYGWNRPSETLIFSAGSPPVTEPVEDSTEPTGLPLYDIELDITDPTYLIQGSSRIFHSYPLMYICFLIGLWIL
ncbi:Hemicentin-1 like protein [Argiope bruennichi]|uniref:Hemicentin-1 like protein n=1 Tax=Argiope bruennichi TaxID=94029 RepID=A0A8T0FJ72_ARGBR|nr:Hemicentin-1 like protein [Argiope bruennichi]